jgi:HEAT repeat protein
MESPVNRAPPNRQRLVTLVVALALIAAAAWAWYRSKERPRPTETPETSPLRPVMLREEDLTEEEKAKHLPEYAELKAFLRLKPQEFTPQKAARAIELSRHPKVWIRILALGALSRARDDDALRDQAATAIVERLRDEDLMVRLAAMDALAGLGAKDRIPELLRFLDSPDRDERLGAKRALQKLGHPIE